MQNKIKICEIFESIQGEGRYAGTPMLFIRTSGCTRNCWFCDTKYHTKGIWMTVKQLIKAIDKLKYLHICWTGGEPLIQRDVIEQIIDKTNYKNHHLETNGDLLIREDFKVFNYLTISPKDEQQAKKITELSENGNCDIKIVTDLKTNKDLISYATILMPLTTGNQEEDLKTQQNVWQYCVKNNINYSPRIHIDVWGQKRKK